MFALVLITSVLSVQVFSAENVDFAVVRQRHNALFDAFYGGVNQRISEISQKNNSKTTPGSRIYDEVLCTEQFLNGLDALNRTELWAVTGE